MKNLKFLLALLPLLLFGCGDIIERDEWQNGIYALSSSDTTSLFLLYHDPYQKEFVGTSPLYVQVDDKDPNTENPMIGFHISIAEGESGELSSKEIHTAYENNFTYNGKAASIQEATLTTSGVSLTMSIGGISQSYQLHKLRDWKVRPFIDSGQYTLNVDTCTYHFTFYPQGGDKFLVLFQDSDPTIEDYTFSVNAKSKKVLTDEEFTLRYQADYSAQLRLAGKTYEQISFYNGEEGVQFQAHYFDTLEHTVEKTLTPAE